MKKSNALMLSYIIFLTIALLANVFGEWDDLDRIAMAATIAGCFFAFADLFEWQSTFKSYYCDKIKVMQKSIIGIELDEINFLEERKKELEYILEKATNYKGRDSNFDILIDYATKTLDKDKKRKENCEQSIVEFTERYQKTRKINNKKFEVASLTLFVFGFVSFFSIIVFDFLTILLTNYQSFVTVIAFVVIMCNYYFKDVIEKDMKVKFDELAEELKQSKKNQDELNQDYKKLDLPNLINEFIESIKRIENNTNVSEDENNG